MQQFENLANDRMNHFNIVGRTANLNDRIDNIITFKKKYDTPVRRSLLKPLNRRQQQLDMNAVEQRSLKRNNVTAKLTPIQTSTYFKPDAAEITPKNEQTEKVKSTRQPTEFSAPRIKSNHKKIVTSKTERTQIDQEELDKIGHLMRHNMATFLFLIGKREFFWDRMIKQQLTPTMFNGDTLKLSREQQNILQESIQKIKRFLSNRSRYKYRMKIQYSSLLQLQIINYNIKKRERKINNTKSQKLMEQVDEEDQSPPPRKKKNAVNAPDFATWKKLNNVGADQKVYIVKGGYQDVRDELDGRDWAENPDVYSPFFDLKWTCKIQDIDFDSVQDHQIVNHFDQNQNLTSKYGLCKNVRSLCWFEKTNYNDFYPRCYDLADQQDFQDFLEDYKITKCHSILREFLANLLELNPANMLRIRLSVHVIQRNALPLSSLLASLLFHDTCPLVQAHEWRLLKKDNPKDVPILDALHDALVEASLPHFDDEESFRRHYTPIAEKEINAQSPQFSLNGPRNIWIVKPDFSSRGRGIRCFDKLNDILDHTMSKNKTYVVQKYIENPLVIKGRKFDIRQWVLVHELFPPKIWFFNECYVRFSAEQFDLDNFQNRYAHLTNNSIAKYSNQFYKSDIKGNMWFQEQFANHLKELTGKDIFTEVIQPKFKEIIIYTIKCCADQMRCKKKSFEIFGYDFMIDSNYNVWLIEINSSPAMDYSTQVTAQLVPRILQDSMKVVLDNPYKKNLKKTGSFQLIYSGEEKQQLVSL